MPVERSESSLRVNMLLFVAICMVPSMGCGTEQAALSSSSDRLTINQVSLVSDAVFGPDSVIRNEETGQEFLGLDFTAPYDYDEVVAELGPGGDFAGWAVATRAELELLGEAADIEHGSVDVDMLARAEELRDWFGNVRLSTTHEVARGLVLDTIDVTGVGIKQLAFSVGRRFNVTPHAVDFRISGWGPIYSDESTYLIRAAVVVTDSDGDGVPDDVDCEPNSDLGATIVIDGCDTGVANELFGDGCTMADLIAQEAAAAGNHGGFVSAVAALANDWKQDGLISGSEKGAIQSCAAGSSLP